MMRLSEALRVALVWRGLGLVEVLGHSVFVGEVEGMNGNWLCVAEAPDGDGLLVLGAVLPVEVGERNRICVVELAMHLNVLLRYGHFGVRGDDGRVVFKLAVPVREVNEGAVQWISSVLNDHSVMVDIHIPVFRSVAEGELSVSEAVAKFFEGISEGDHLGLGQVFGWFGSN